MLKNNHGTNGCRWSSSESITKLNNKLQGRLLGGNNLALAHSIMLTAFSDYAPLMESLDLLYVELKNKRDQLNTPVRDTPIKRVFIVITTAYNPTSQQPFRKAWSKPNR